ncbi:MAG: ComF family protein, partial [Vampirovibrionia bacterium]
ICKEFAYLTKNEYSNKVLIRTKNTSPQHNLNVAERKENLKGAFSIQTKPLENKKILLFDDIYTTGSTIKEAIKTLNLNNINDITVLTVSYARLHKSKM